VLEVLLMDEVLHDTPPGHAVAINECVRSGG
jgi:hypothetical protein